MFCKNCGTKLENKSKFCVNCGWQVGSEVTKESKIKSGIKFPKMFLLLGVLFLVCIMIKIVFFSADNPGKFAKLSNGLQGYLFKDDTWAKDEWVLHNKKWYLFDEDGEIAKNQWHKAGDGSDYIWVSDDKGKRCFEKNTYVITNNKRKKIEYDEWGKYELPMDRYEYFLLENGVAVCSSLGYNLKRLNLKLAKSENDNLSGENPFLYKCNNEYVYINESNTIGYIVKDKDIEEIDLSILPDSIPIGKPLYEFYGENDDFLVQCLIKENDTYKLDIVTPYPTFMWDEIRGIGQIYKVRNILVDNEKFLNKNLLDQINSKNIHIYKINYEFYNYSNFGGEGGNLY